MADNKPGRRVWAIVACVCAALVVGGIAWAAQGGSSGEETTEDHPPVASSSPEPAEAPVPDASRSRGSGERVPRARRSRSSRRARQRPEKAGEDEREERMLRPGESSDSVRGLQTRLADLGYWLGRPDGNFGTLTQQAVIAFQGAEGLARDGIVGPQTTRALATAEPPRARSEGGNLIEIDEDRGLLLVVQNGEVELALHTSTGTDQTYISPTGGTNVADTPDGRWSIAWAFDGWREGPLGRMWRPRYFHSDGVAIHGYESVPPYPASHGCARVSMAGMDLIWARDLAPEGGTVWVY